MTPVDDEPERWLPVVGYEGRYEVSDQGRVRSRRHTSRHIRGDTVLTPYLTAGYPAVSLYSGERVGGRLRRRTALVHDLVLTAFVSPRPEPGMECCHADDVRTNNVISNLSWGTSLDNSDDMRRNGGHGNTKKTHCIRGHRLVAPNLKPRKNPNERECLCCKQAHTLASWRRQNGKAPLDVDAYADQKYRVLMGEEPVRSPLVTA